MQQGRGSQKPRSALRLYASTIYSIPLVTKISGQAVMAGVGGGRSG